MAYRIYSESDIITQSRTLIHAFMMRQMVSFRELLAEDFVWIGDYTSQYIKGRDAFMKAISEEVMLPTPELSQEEYSILTHERYTWVSYGRLTATMQAGPDTFLASGIHFTFVWKQEKDDLYLSLASTAHVQDDPQQNEAPDNVISPVRRTPQARLFDHISPEELMRTNTPKIFLRDKEGNLHYLFPDEIIYAKSDDKYCTVYTTSSTLCSYMPLKDLELPGFLRIHKQYLVNLSCVVSLRRYELKLFHDVVLPIGKGRFQEVQRRIAGE